MAEGERFSKRFGYRDSARGITVREDAPRELREAVVQIAYSVGVAPSALRKIVCRAPRVQPSQGNWSEYPNIAGEVDDLVSMADWYRVYDIAEAIYAALAGEGLYDLPRQFEEELNDVFVEAGIGWQMTEGEIQSRGTETFEATLANARTSLELAGKRTANQELHEALLDLSRRPEPDLTGALQHVMAALECVARDVAGDQQATLGQIMSRYPGLVPKPLDQVIEKAWGFASENARHLREGAAPLREEVELVVGIAAALAGFLAKGNAIRRN